MQQFMLIRIWVDRIVIKSILPHFMDNSVGMSEVMCPQSLSVFVTPSHQCQRTEISCFQYELREKSHVVGNWKVVNTAGFDELLCRWCECYTCSVQADVASVQDQVSNFALYRILLSLFCMPVLCFLMVFCREIIFCAKVTDCLLYTSDAADE